MAYLVIGCDQTGGAATGSVEGALHSWGAVRLLESLWVLETPLDANYVRSALEDVVEGEKPIAVIALQPGSDWSTSNVISAGSDWLRSNIGG